MKYRRFMAVIAAIILLGSILDLTLHLEPVYASHNSNHSSNSNSNGNSNNNNSNNSNNNDHSTHFTFGTITASSSIIQLPPGSPTSTTISVPVTNTHQTLASSVNPGEGNTFITLFASGTNNNINSQFTITRTDSITAIQSGATATLTYTVSTIGLTTYTGSIDVQAFASGRLPPPEQGAVQIQLHTVTSSIAGNVFTVLSPSSLTVTTSKGGVAAFNTDNGRFSNLDSVAETSLPTESKPAIDFPNGLFTFTISNLSQGATITITITFPSAVPAGSQYWKVIGNTWVKLPDEFVGDNDGDNILTLTLTDGGTGDADGLANGVIVDPGGPGTSSTGSSVVGSGATGGSCDGRIVVTNDRKIGGRCVIFDTQPPKIIKAFVTVNDYLCIKGTDDTGIARVTVNGIEFAPWSGTGNIFCAKVAKPDATFLMSGVRGSSAKIVNLDETFSISATDFAGNNAGAVVLGSKELRTTSKAFATYIDKEYNPHVGIEAVVIKNLNREPLKQVRLMLSSDMDRGRFLLSEYAFKQIDDAEKVTVIMNTKNSKEFQGYLIVSASNTGILSVLPVDVKVSDFHIGKPVVHQKKQTVYLDTIDIVKLSPAKPLNSLQMVEFDKALKAIVDGEALTPMQHRILRYAISS